MINSRPTSYSTLHTNSAVEIGQVQSQAPTLAFFAPTNRSCQCGLKDDDLVPVSVGQPVVEGEHEHEGEEESGGRKEVPGGNVVTLFSSSPTLRTNKLELPTLQPV